MVLFKKNKHKQGNRMPIYGLTSDYKHDTIANQRTPKEKKHNDKLLGSLELEPNSCHTNKKRDAETSKETQRLNTQTKRESGTRA